ncbi:class II fructose-bisphosphate aldolase [Staphylococcus auricularis]|uniref:class II fructose-bisphosphate aldolase n=1 Tax=Staphylococcus auricularis TaxID=29379 RepID=UPI00243148A8|nr:ketose-bisphosphate aldolase [Staphylococcus auricularis]
MTYNEMLREAKANHYAVPQININDAMWIEPILKAAMSMRSPIIIATSDKLTDAFGGYHFIAQTIKQTIQTMDVDIPAMIHLDHSLSVDHCKQAVEAGYDSVMFDGSKLSIDDNVTYTSEVVEAAHPQGIAVEGEIGGVGGQEDGIEGEVKYARLEDCLRLVNEAQADVIAPALGSAHGEYKGEPKLGFDLMSEINDAVQVPLALHGATGISEDDLTHAIQLGHAKINFNTEVKKAWAQKLREVLDNDPSLYEPQSIIQPAKDAIEAAVTRLIQTCHSDGKA